MAVVGCDIPVRQVVGADRLVQAKAGLWTKTHFYQEGDFLHAKTFLVVAGNPQVLEFRIDLRPLEKVAARIHQRLHDKMVQKNGGPVVGFSFSKAFKSIKSAAKSIGKSKLVKAVGGAIKSVAKSKLVGVLATGLAVAVPFVGVPALAAYGTAKAAIGAVSKGKKLVATAGQAQRTISAAANVTQKIAVAKRQAPAQVQAVQAQAKARASALAARALSNASAQSSVAASNAVKAAAAAKAKATLAQGKAQATAAARNVVAQVKAAETKIAPVVAAARTLQQKLADPAVRAKLTTIKKQADSAKKVLTDIQQTAAHGTGAAKLDAQKSAAIVNLVAKNEARIQAMSQANAGGLPSLLIDSRGRIVPGKFRIVAAGGGKNPDVLYRGPKTTTERGAFAKVSGVPGIGASHVNWWTLEIKPEKSPRWVSLQPNGILFNEHWRAAKAVDWYAQRGVPAKATLVKYTPTPSELKKNQNRIGASPFPPPSPSEKRAKDAAYAAWLKKHSRRGVGGRGSGVGQIGAGWGENTPLVGYAPSPAWATTIGCPCSDQGTLF